MLSVKTFAEEQQDWWDMLPVEKQAAIEASIQELDKGQGIPRDEHSRFNY